MSFDLVVHSQILYICAWEMSPPVTVCHLSGVSMHNTAELGKVLDGNVTCCLLLCKCLQEACGSVHTGEGIFESLLDKNRHSYVIHFVKWITQDRYIYTLAPSLCSFTLTRIENKHHIFR